MTKSNLLNKAEQLQPPRGMRDFFPDDIRQREWLFSVWTQTASEFGFEPYDAPVVENLELLKRKAGEEITDQIYHFMDKSGRGLALRPEMTPSLVRMVLARKGSLRFPVKWFSIPQCFTGILILVCWVSLGVYWNISDRSIKSTTEAQSLAARLARMPVWLGFVLFFAAWVRPFGPAATRRTVVSDSIAVAICVLGLFLAIWSRKALGAEWSRDVELKQGHKLVESGPYRFMRHPIYTGHLLMGVGTAIASGLLVAFAGLASFLVGFWIKLNQEEHLLTARFSRRIPSLQGARQGADSLCVLTCGEGTIGSIMLCPEATFVR